MLKNWWNRTFSRKSGQTRRVPGKRVLRFEPLEQRTLLTVNVTVVPPTWVFEGPTIADPAPAFNNPVFGNGTVAYDSVSSIIVGGSTVNGVGSQSVTGQATGWETLPVGSPVGGPSGIVQIDNTSIPGESIRYTSGSFLRNLTGQAFTRNNVPVLATPPTAIPLIVNGSDDGNGNPLNLYQIEPLSASVIAPQNPWALNTVDPRRLIIGTDYLYESSDDGQTLDSVGGLTSVFNLATGLDETIDDPTPGTSLIGPVTALEYGGRNSATSANPDLLWVGTSGASGFLFLRTGGTGMPTAVTSYTGGVPQAIVSNPNNWQQTFVIDAFSVYETINGGATWTVITGNLNTNGLSSIAYISNPGGIDSLAVGINGAVERMPLTNKNAAGQVIGGVWTQLGTALPPFNVGSLQYNPATDLLVAGSNGGGAWELPRASSALPTNVITVNGNGAADNVNFVLSGTNLVVTDTSGAAPNIATVGIGSISGVIVTNLGGVSTVNLDFTNGNPVPNALFSVNGAGSISTTIKANAGSNYNLSDTSLKFPTLNRTVTLQNVKIAQLTGTGNTFDVSGWTGTGNLNGIGPSNTVVDTNNANFTISGGAGQSGVFTVSTGTNMVLNNIAGALLTGGIGANTFNLTNWVGTGVITGGGGADNLTQTGASSYTFSSAQYSAKTGALTSLLNLVGIPSLALTGAVSGATFLDNGLTGGAAAVLTAQGGANTLTSQKDVDFTFTGNNKITAGASTLTYNGPFTAINVTGGATAHIVDVGAYTNAVRPTINAPADTIKATVGGATVSFTLDTSSANTLNINAAANVNFSIAAIAAAVLTATGATDNFTVNAFNRPVTLTATAGTSNFTIGNGNLNNITGKVTLAAPNGKLAVNDSTYNTAGQVSYHLDSALIAIDTTSTPARPTALGGVGVSYSGGINNVTVKGSAGNAASTKQFWNQYLVTPSATTVFNVDNSAVGAGNAIKGYLGVVFLGSKSHTQTFAGNNGSWDVVNAANQHETVNWTNITPTNMNGLGLLVLGGGTQASNTSQPIVQVYDGETGAFDSQFLAYPSTFQLGIKVASGGDLGGVKGPLIATAPGRGIAGTINFYTKNTAPAGTVSAATPQGTVPAATIGSFQPYGAGYTDGINISFGVFNAATKTIDLIVAPQRGALPVKVYQVNLAGAVIPAPTLIGSFLAYPASYIGGVNVAGGDIFGNGVTDVVTAPQSGMQATVEVWDGTKVKTNSAVPTFSFLAMTASFRGGVSLAVGDVNGDGKADIVTGAGSTGGSIVSVFSGVTLRAKKTTPSTLLGIIGTNPTVNGAMVTPFAAYTDPSNFAPVSVALKDVDGDGRLEIVTAQGTNGKSNLLRYWKVNPGGTPQVFQYPNTSVGAPPSPLGGLAIG
jgi:hypothetical protein